MIDWTMAGLRIVKVKKTCGLDIGITAVILGSGMAQDWHDGRNDTDLPRAGVVKLDKPWEGRRCWHADSTGWMPLTKDKRILRRLWRSR